MGIYTQILLINYLYIILFSYYFAIETISLIVLINAAVIFSHHQFGLMRRLMAKPPKRYVCPAKTPISLGIRPVRLECLQYAKWVSEDPMFLHADSEDSDQTGQMSRLIWVLAGRKGHFIGSVMTRLIFYYNSNKTWGSAGAWLHSHSAHLVYYGPWLIKLTCVQEWHRSADLTSLRWALSG